MKVYILLVVFFCFLITLSLVAQIDTTYTQATPVGGIKSVVQLESINGLTNRAIKDSLHAQTAHLQMFIPEIPGG